MLAVTAMLSGLGATARADSVGTHGFDAEAHARMCRCAAHCRGEACCCGRSAASPRRAPESLHANPRREATKGAGPCLGEEPCGDPGIPSSTPPGPINRAATVALSLSRRPPMAGALLPPPNSCRLLPARPTRIDRPPRR